MFKKIIKILVLASTIVFFAFFEISFLKTLGPPFSYFDIILTISIFTAVTFSFNRSLIWIILGGYLLDLYSPYPFGIVLSSMLAAILITKGLSRWRLTSHTLYSLIILTALGNLIYQFCFFFLNKILMFFGNSNIYYSLNASILWHIAANVCLVILCFIIVKQLSKRFRTSYL
jgi:hypothetical protein